MELVKHLQTYFHFHFAQHMLIAEIPKFQLHSLHQSQQDCLKYLKNKHLFFNKRTDLLVTRAE